MTILHLYLKILKIIFHMNIVEEEANSFYRDLFSRGKVHNLGNFKSDLTLKLYDFNK